MVLGQTNLRSRGRGREEVSQNRASLGFKFRKRLLHSLVIGENPYMLSRLAIQCNRS